MGRRHKDGNRVFFEPLTQLPPRIEGELSESLLHIPAPPEDNVAGVRAPEAEAGELGSRVMKGVSWTVLGTLVTQVLGVARTVGLARLLTQADFGVAAMALTVIGALYTFTHTGVVESVIASRFEDDDELHRYANQVWTLEIVRGLLICILLLALALPFTWFYKEPRLLPMLVTLSLTPLCTSLQNVGLYLQLRKVDMKPLTMHGFYTNTLTVLTTLGLAAITRNYWALVWGQVLGAFMGMALSFVFSSYRPRLLWDWTLARRAYEFGRNIFVIGIANYALTTVDNVVVGYWQGKEVLGVYVVAYTFCNLARTLVNNAFNSVLFPAFAMAEREDDPERLRRLVERSFTLGILVLTAMLLPLITFAPAILRVFYGTKWAEAVLPMRLLLVAGFFAGLQSLFSAFFVGLNRTQVESKGKIWDAILFAIVLFPLTIKFGAPGAALSGVIAWAGSITWRWKWANDIVKGSLNRLPVLLLSSVAVGALACWLGILPWAQGMSGWIHAFEMTPSLLTAWTQILLGGTLVSGFCVAAFAILHPVARGELAGLKTKVAGKLKRG